MKCQLTTTSNLWQVTIWNRQCVTTFYLLGFLKILGCLMVAFPAKDFTGGDDISIVTNTMMGLPTTWEWFILPILNQWLITPDIRVVVVQLGALTLTPRSLPCLAYHYFQHAYPLQLNPSSVVKNCQYDKTLFFDNWFLCFLLPQLDALLEIDR